MSYSGNVKAEIMANTQTVDACCALSEAAALFALGGKLVMGRGSLALRFESEHAGVARRVYSLFKRLTGARGELSVHKHARLARKNLYRVDLPDPGAARGFLLAAQVLNEEGGLQRGVPLAILSKNCCKRAYLRGAFLAAGTITSPENSYQLALYTDSEEYAAGLRAFLESMGLNAKSGTRRGSFVVYLKESDSIVDFLALAGASAAVLEMENTRILKGIHNDINRAMNCETANFEKTHSAATAQIGDIQYLIDHGAFPKLSKALRETAEIRLEYPEATLADLGELLVPAQSKSCINHRMAKLRRIAQDLRAVKEEIQ